MVLPCQSAKLSFSQPLSAEAAALAFGKLLQEHQRLVGKRHQLFLLRKRAPLVKPQQCGGGGWQWGGSSDWPVDAGGGTVFRHLQQRYNNNDNDIDSGPLTVQPAQGTALLFSPAFANGQPDERT